MIANYLLLFQNLESDLLLHPVVKSFISWKWSRYIAWFYILDLTFYLVFLCFLTGFAVHVHNPQLDICKKIYSFMVCGVCK